MSVRWTDACPASPEEVPASQNADGEYMHECLPDEMRCAYCGERIDPYPCHGCGKFLTAKLMHLDDGVHRCKECC